MIALRAPQYLTLGIATLLTAGIWAARATPHTARTNVLVERNRCHDLKRIQPREVESAEPACDPNTISSVVIRGQFSSRERQHEGFAISFAGSTGRYTAMTDHRGYFEVRIPREDFEGDVCELPLRNRDFSDAQMTLQYSIDIER